MDPVSGLAGLWRGRVVAMRSGEEEERNVELGV